MALPYYKDPVVVTAGVTGGRGHVMADKFAILHFVLSSLANTPSPVDFVKDVMFTYLGDDLFYKKIVFDLDGAGEHKHERVMSELTRDLKRYGTST